MNFRTVTVLFVLIGLTACDDLETGKLFSAPDENTCRPIDDNSYCWQALTPGAGERVLQVTTSEGTSVFNMRGEAVAGPLAERKRLLKRYAGVHMFWFAWSVFFPGSDIWGTEDKVKSGSLPSDKTGVSGCSGGADCIPSLPVIGKPPSGGNLGWVKPGAKAAAYLSDTDMVIGIFYNGAARAYPHNILWWHEIANDYIQTGGGDRINFTVSYCPLTGSGIIVDGGSSRRTFGVSGRLFNANLIMYDHDSDSLWSQLYYGGISGKKKGSWLKKLPYIETTWGQWKAMHPDTIVVGDDTGYTRNYNSYPYGSYRTNSSTFMSTTPAVDSKYSPKAMTLGLFSRPDGAGKAYVHTDLFDSTESGKGVVADAFNGKEVIVVFDEAKNLVMAFEAETPEGLLEFSLVEYEP